MPGPGCRAATATRSLPKPDRSRCATASTTCPPRWPDTLAAVCCVSTGPGLTRTRSPRAGTGSKPSPHRPTNVSCPHEQQTGEVFDLREGGARCHPRRHAKALLPRLRDKPGRTQNPVRQRPPRRIEAGEPTSISCTATSQSSTSTTSLVMSGEKTPSEPTCSDSPNSQGEGKGK